MSNTFKKAARDLRRGDVIVEVNERSVCASVVLSVKPAANGVALEAWNLEDRRTESTAWGGSVSVTVESAGMRATDAEIDLLVETARDYLETDPAMMPARLVNLQKLVDRLSPVQAPTLAETLDALRVLANEGAVGVHLNAATRLLDRARRAGVMP